MRRGAESPGEFDNSNGKELHMPPNDPTPLGDAMTHRFPDQTIPSRKPGDRTDAEKAADIAHRPALPDHPTPMAADVEDEDADPVVDSGPGIADGMDGLKKQKG
jgi:hypothetical protein